MAKNEILSSLTIKDMTNLGHGVADHDGRVVFVKGGVRGDVLDAVIIKETKSYSVAAIKNLISPSPYREDNKCTCYKTCGGCVFRHISYDEEKRIKYNYVVNAFKKIAGIDITPESIDTHTSDGYRNNVRYPVGVDKDGRLFPGFFSEKSHNIIKVENCLTQKPAFIPVINYIFKAFNENNLTAYNEETAKGYIRHVCLRTSRDGKVAVCVVINGEVDEKLKKIAEKVVRDNGSVVSFSANINTKKTNVIFGEKTTVLIEKESLTEKICGKAFKISPRSFFQVNSETAEMMFDKAREYLDLKGGEVLLDLYCGTGTVGICVAPDGVKLFGSEIVPEAVEDAWENARINNVGDYTFVCGDASEGAAKCVEKYGIPDAITVDPPRKGLSEETVDAILSSGAKKLVYISCNPDTLARDVKILTQSPTSAYTLSRITLFDLFPRTSHVECVTLMSRAKNQV